MKRLPPLTGIEAFIQVARLGSVKAAAEALALSSPALTRRVQALERHVGKPLFERRHQAIILNADGERLLAGIGPSLDSLTLAMEQASGEHDLMRLRLGVLPLYASQRLMPRLPALRSRHPDLHIDIDTAPYALTRLAAGAQGRLDAGIVLAKTVDSGLYARRLGGNRAVAIAARALTKGADALREPSDLARATVLLHRDLVDTFERWCEAMGVPGLEPAAFDHFDSGQLILEAAAQGLGVAFMFETHLESARDARLVQLFDSAPSPYSYWFACRRAALGRRPVRLFHDWLVGEVAGEDED
ncbi:LysR substrate-binding domain-containing protein [Sphingosinicella sp. YJ22]|uniref:LysR substrate-binding domain-containing protein n=1 Tax=Sphingosinicella sp. YJ22 TaxID=1104780 RepID=UPI0014072E14|nr:LysR substrate-binding domain-containing protein [Sphingosinicella sp. YJ22]